MWLVVKAYWDGRSLKMNKTIFLAGHLCLSYIHLRLEECRTFLCLSLLPYSKEMGKRRVGVYSRGHVRALQLNKLVPGSIISILYS
jgi:hypothetical protein